MNIFVTGTGTNIGKTIASALLLASVKEKGKTISYHKPIQTGSKDDSDSLTVGRLLNEPSVVSTGMSFKKPLTPHWAAYYDNQYIERSQVIKNIIENAKANFNVVE